MGSALPTLQVSQWHASLELQFTQRPSGCRLIKADRKGPLSVQRPFYPEGPELAHCYLLHPPGGLVSGDLLAISAHCNEGSQVLITTPGAGRAYRARETQTQQRQRQRFTVEQNASLEWLPMETIVYPGANLHSETDFHLSANSSLIAWDVICLGLPASQQAFERGQFCQRTRVFQDGRLSLIDRFALNAPSPVQSQAAGLNGRTVLGLLIVGPFSDSTSIDELTDTLRDRELPLTCTRIEQWLVVRYLGNSAFDARKAFEICWRHCRPRLLNRTACAPRIWAT
ncbi:MAG: urease accessory protein [Spongiibacteraceae bacterium]|jgi:urease accessory protein|nr:urease accessory protein [Spongiibacteraceae bacterium]